MAPVRLIVKLSMSILQEKLKHHSQQGFSLIEALVALAILSVALVPAVLLSNSALRAASVIRDDTIAAGLAQEGIEVVRTIRDANWFTGAPFNQGLDDGSYRVQWDSVSLMAAGGNPPLNLTDGIYSYDS